MKLTNVATAIQYEPFASIKQATLGNTLTMTNSWGDDGRLAYRRLKAVGGKNRSLLAYTYDNDDNITRITDGVNAAKTVSYEYDVRGRLLAAQQLNSGQVIYNRFDYLHDANGNRTALERRYTKGPVPPDTVDNYTLTPGTNRLASITTDALTRNLIYDARGNLSTETRGPAVTATTAYDGYGRLLSYARTSEDSLSHSYNGLDDRIATARTPAGGGNADVRRFVTAPDGRVMGEYGSSASDVRAEFIWLNPTVGDAGMFGGDDGLGGYMPIALATAAPGGGTTLNWVHADHMGTPIVITDATGIAIAQPGGYTTPAFPGQSRTLADLYYNRYRDYDPTTGRYIQADPIGLAGGQSPYSYAMGNPLRYSDPTGLMGHGSGGNLNQPNGKPKYPGYNPRLAPKKKDDCPEPPPIDWCGSKGSEWVPDGNWGAACRNHDACYGTSGASKLRCDGQLALEIAAECTENTYGVGLPVCGIIGFLYGGGLATDGLLNPWSPSADAYMGGQKR